MVPHHVRWNWSIHSCRIQRHEPSNLSSALVGNINSQFLHDWNTLSSEQERLIQIVSISNTLVPLCSPAFGADENNVCYLRYTVFNEPWSTKAITIVDAAGMSWRQFTTDLHAAISLNEEINAINPLITFYRAWRTSWKSSRSAMSWAQNCVGRSIITETKQATEARHWSQTHRVTLLISHLLKPGRNDYASYTRKHGRKYTAATERKSDIAYITASETVINTLTSSEV